MVKYWLQVLNTLEEIQERHDAVKEIEKKLLDLHQVHLWLHIVVNYQIKIVYSNTSIICQIYLDMAVLVEAQGEILDNIESQVCFATHIIFCLN